MLSRRQIACEDSPVIATRNRLGFGSPCTKPRSAVESDPKTVLAPLAILARFWHRLIGSLRDQNHLAAALATAVLRPPPLLRDADYKSVDGKGPIRNQLDHNGLNYPTILWGWTHLDPFGLISDDAVYKTGYNAFLLTTSSPANGVSFFCPC